MNPFFFYSHNEIKAWINVTFYFFLLDAQRYTYTHTHTDTITTTQMNYTHIFYYVDVFYTFSHCLILLYDNFIDSFLALIMSF
jgi:hypothetical protein